VHQVNAGRGEGIMASGMLSEGVEQRHAEVDSQHRPAWIDPVPNSFTEKRHFAQPSSNLSFLPSI